MAQAAKQSTVMSTKGQVILPKAVREARGWGPGTRLSVEDTPEGVLIRKEAVFPRTTPDEVFGSLRYDGPPKSIEEMDAAIEAEVKRRHARGRY
jgi:AbrB family looped-hinge helix DNA binding protein